MYLCPHFYKYYFRFPNSTYSITVNTAANTLTLYEDGKVYKTYPVAVGKPNDIIPTTQKRRALTILMLRKKTYRL